MTHRTPRLRIRLNSEQKNLLGAFIREGKLGYMDVVVHPYGAKCDLTLWSPFEAPEFEPEDYDNPYAYEHIWNEAIVRDNELLLDATLHGIFTDKDVQVVLRKAKGKIVITPVSPKRRRAAYLRRGFMP